MSYTFLLDQGEESSAECFSAIPACVLSRLSPTAVVAFSNASEMESCQGSRFGMTLQHSMAGHGEESLTQFAAASPARTLVEQTKTLSAYPESVPGYGSTWPESLAKYDLNTSSWKTRQCLLLGGLESFSETWPKWGWMQGGEFWGLDIAEASTFESEYGFLPTPLASDGRGGGLLRSKSGKEYNLRDWWARQGLGKYPRNRRPEFWEWVMGWPMGWTALSPLETDKFQSWLQKHGDS